ncbi:hypothetical protein FB45DRAFT_900979 [Roridomyces roridus]|uniref:Uncharacterized protein n=1 Tax=Roridomyces roridus TaxID=1738132 RepID=A0AAD7C872_9AGAR|nr:hypothetical protein FB45DRAFT_900979 [Roridomyces roridus]
MATFAPPPPAEVIDIADSDDEGPTASSGTTMRQENPKAANIIDEFDSDLEDEEEEKHVEHKPLISPSVDIKEEFENALQDGFEFDGAFAYSKRYEMSAAPNPCLNIDGLGAVGIPLSERDARAIIAASTPVTSPSGDTGSWEMPSDKVRFDNPAWDVWLQKTAGSEASTALISSNAVRPSFALKKLVIHEKSSFTSRRKDPISDDESDTKIGDLIAILPGLFDGANLQLRHAGQVKSLNFAHQSGLSTSIVAAYSGVEHTLAGVSSGYRLSLHYDIVQPIAHAMYRPMLPEMQGATHKLHNILLSWKQDASGQAPPYIACLLQHKYIQNSNFKGKSLTGADALLLSHLYPLARDLKFRIYLAHVELNVSTSCSAPGYHGGYGGFGGYGGYGRRRGGWLDDEVDEDEFEEDDEGEEEFYVTSVVDLRGMPVSVDLDLEADDLVNGAIKDGDADSSELDRMERTSAMRIEIYKRTVLFLWPKDGEIDRKVNVGDIYDYACNALRTSLSVEPTKREKQLVDKLMRCCQTRRQDAKLPLVMQVLRESADRWNDVQVLLRALKVCGVDKNTDLMGLEGFVSAYQAFGWDALKEFYTDAMKNDESNARRHALLARLTKMGMEEQDAEVLAWCNEQAESRLRSLGKVDATQIPWLVQLGLSRGGEFLRDVIFPQLQAQKLEKTFWIPFLQQLQTSMQGAPTTSPQVVRGLIVQCVTETVRNLAAFPTKTIKSPYASHHGGDREEKDSGAIVEVIKLCVETKNEGLCTSIFAKMREATQKGPFNATFPPWIYYSELCSSLNTYMQTVPGLSVPFQPFFSDAVAAMVSSARKAPDGKPITPCPLSDTHHATVVLAAKAAGGIAVLQQRLTAATLQGHDTRTLQGLTRCIKNAFSAQGSAAYNRVLATLVCTMIDRVDTAALFKGGYSYATYSYGSPSEQMLSLVKFCFEVGAQNQCQRLLLRFVPPPTGVTVAKHVSDVLAPFLPVLKQYLATQNLDLRTDPYRMFAAAVVKGFAEHVMTAKPTEMVSAAQLATVGCGMCAECRELRAFFLSARESIAFSRVQAIRTHLERQLGGVARTWGVQLATLRHGSPHTLQITKPPSMTALGQWNANTQTGKSLLQTLGDPATVLGADYPVVYARIHHTSPPVPLASASQTMNVAPKHAAPTAAGPLVAKKPRVI